MKQFTLALAVFGLLVAASDCQAQLIGTRRAHRHALRMERTMSWHGNYYHTNYGRPVALVVSPRVRMQSSYGWGVSQSTMSPIYHQFHRPYPGPFSIQQLSQPVRPTPLWPSHTGQFGVYYIRGPW